MSIIDWFAKRNKKKTPSSEKLNIPGNLWTKCDHCQEVFFIKDLETNLKVCLQCQHHFRLLPDERLRYFFDADSFKEIETHLRPIDFLEFKDTEKYVDRLKKATKKTNRTEALKKPAPQKKKNKRQNQKKKLLKKRPLKKKKKKKKK